MALTYKKLSDLQDVAPANINSTTKFIITTGEVKTNNNLKVSDFVVDDLITSSTTRPLSSRMGKKLQDEKATKLYNAKNIPNNSNYTIIPTDNGSIITVQSSGSSSCTISITAGTHQDFPVGFNVKIYAYDFSGPSTSDSSIFFNSGDSQQAFFAGATDEGNKLPLNTLVEIIKVSETLWITSTRLFAI